MEENIWKFSSGRRLRLAFEDEAFQDEKADQLCFRQVEWLEHLEVERGEAPSAQPPPVAAVRPLQWRWWQWC